MGPGEFPQPCYARFISRSDMNVGPGLPVPLNMNQIAAIMLLAAMIFAGSVFVLGDVLGCRV